MLKSSKAYISIPPSCAHARVCMLNSSWSAAGQTRYIQGYRSLSGKNQVWFWILIIKSGIKRRFILQDFRSVNLAWCWKSLFFEMWQEISYFRSISPSLVVSRRMAKAESRLHVKVESNDQFFILQDFKIWTWPGAEKAYFLKLYKKSCHFSSLTASPKPSQSSAGRPR